MEIYPKYYVDVVATGNRIADFMTQKGLTVEEFSDIVGVAESKSVSNWRNGKAFPSYRFLFAMSRAFDVAIEEIVVVVDVDLE